MHRGRLPVDPIEIRLPASFGPDHQTAVIDYLADRLIGRAAWAKAFEAFDLLDQATLATRCQRRTFRALYQQAIEQGLTDSYLRELLLLGDVERQGPALWASYARQIVDEATRRAWFRADVPETRLLLSYFLYWWGSFARGYALEAMIFRDLRRSGVSFQAHDVLDRLERYSSCDLTVSGIAGDLKTSVYFVQTGVSLAHDFYIVRLQLRRRTYTLVVLLQPLVWERIDGDTMEASLETLDDFLPAPVRIEHRDHALVVIEYDDWKERILRLQGVER